MSCFVFNQVFDGLVELVTSSGNYSRYRQRFSECSGFRFPILGVHLKDLIAVHVALPDWVDREKSRVNLTKTHQLYAILEELAVVQSTPPNIEANSDLLNLLIVSLIQAGWSVSAVLHKTGFQILSGIRISPKSFSVDIYAGKHEF